MIEEIVASWGIEYQVKKMFGGVAYMLYGNMACATLSTGELIIRTLDEDKPELLNRDGVSQAFMKGVDMGNWVSVDPEGFEHDELAELMVYGRNKALSLPPK
jgi:hypothetical protein